MRRLATSIGLSALVALPVAFAAWAIGVTLRQSAVIFVCVVALGAIRGGVAVQQYASAGEQWRGRWSITRAGARRDVRQLAWRMRADHGRVHGAALQRLRFVATERLRRHGVDLADPSQAGAAETLLGPTAYRVLTARSDRLVRYAAFVRTVDALERLAAPMVPPTAAPTPHPESR